MATNLTEAIIEQRASSSKAVWYADILLRLIWLTADNGHEICRIAASWLRSGDRFRMEVALQITDVFLWDNEAEMEELLGSAISQVSDLQPLINNAGRRWKNTT